MSAATGSYSAASSNLALNARQTDSSSRWIFTEEQLLNVPSIKEGMSPEEELRLRRSAAHTIHQMADRLNHESRVRISQLCICAAMMHMHRFFVFHSFNKFDPRDIAAACLFLAGKSEECPRKLEHVVRVWWAVKFPFSPTLDSTRYHDAAQLIVTLENVVLQTIGNRRLSEIAWWFASDMLHMTNWGVRFPAKTIACVCIQMACSWAEFEIQLPPGSKPWYLLVDPMMTHDKLIELTEEFSQIYRTYGEQLNIRRYLRSSNQQGQRRTHSQSQSQAPSSSLANLPPPPPAPMLTSAAINKSELKAEPGRKIDINDYKQRASGTPNNVLNNAQQSAQRRNFMQPEMTQVTDLPLPPGLVKSVEKKLQAPNDQDTSQSQKRRVEGAEKEILKHRRVETQEKETKHRRSEVVEKEVVKHRRSEDVNSHHRKRQHERNFPNQEIAVSNSGGAQLMSASQPRESAVAAKKVKPASTINEAGILASATFPPNAASIPLPSNSKTAANSSSSSSTSYPSQQHRTSSRSLDTFNRTTTPHLPPFETRITARISSPVTTVASNSQKQHVSSRVKLRDVNTLSIPLPPAESSGEGHGNNASFNSNFVYMKRPQRPISPPPPPSTNRTSTGRTSEISSRIMLPPPPVPPANEELEDGEVL